MTTLLGKESSTAVTEREVVERPPRIEPPKRTKRASTPWMILLLATAVVGAGLAVAYLVSQEDEAVQPLSYHAITAEEANERFGPFGPGLSYRVMTRDSAEDRFGPFEIGLSYHKVTAPEADARFGPFEIGLSYHKVTASEADARFGPFPMNT